MMLKKIERLIEYLDKHEHFSVAVSGGIDSMLLGYIASRFSHSNVVIIHAYSPAVPEAAFMRVKKYSERYQWNLKVIDAEEFSDEDYIKNPVNRCYYCKSNLYSRIAENNSGVIFSGTNLDDLGDYRPGLVAAEELKVRHPYVEVGISKQDIYDIAKYYQLEQLHALPSQPCLASRVETGIKINVDDMAFIDKVEEKVRGFFPDFKNVRCRISKAGIYVEVDCVPEEDVFDDVVDQLSSYCSGQGRVFSGMKEYQKGSAFLNGITHG